MKRIAPLILAAAVVVAGLFLAAPAHAADEPCAAYTYTGTTQTLCDRFPGADRDNVDCGDVTYRVTLVNNDVDPWGLDGSGGGDRGVVGLGCESNPLKPKPSPKASPTKAKPSPSRTQAAAKLPVTGPPAGLLAGGAAGLLAIGAVAFVVARRRRVRFSAE